MIINVKRLPTGYYHVRGEGPCNWTQPEEWPCSEEQIRACAFPEAGETFLRAAIEASRQAVIDGRQWSWT